MGVHVCVLADARVHVWARNAHPVVPMFVFHDEQVVAIRDYVVVAGIPLAEFERPLSAITEWVEGVGAKLLDWLLTEAAVKDNVEELVKDFSARTFDMLECYVTGGTDEERHAAAHSFFTILNAVQELRLANEAPREQT